MILEQIFVSPGHNFFGRHGRPPGEHIITAVDEIECVAGRGIRGDRFFDFRPDYRGQITFFAMEMFEAMLADLGVQDVPPSVVRRNVLTRGLDLPALIGRKFEIQGVQFFGTEECRPCYWMNQAVAPGTEAWLRGRGGLRARITSNGRVRRTVAGREIRVTRIAREDTVLSVPHAGA